MPKPGLAPAFVLDLGFSAPAAVGRIAIGGERSYRPVAGGKCTGERLNGRVTGGGETLLARADRVTVVEASYWIEADGAAIRLVGTGYRTTDGPFVGTRMSIAFEAREDGPHGWLARRVFLGESAPGEDTLRVIEVL